MHTQIRQVLSASCKATIRPLQILVATLLCLILLACAGTIAPQGWREGPEVTQRKAVGAWIRVELAGQLNQQIEGELIAITHERVYVLPLEGDMKVLPFSEVRLAHVQAYNSRYGWLALWTSLGTVSTLSHGFVLLVSAPVWIVAGTLAAAAQSSMPHYEVDASGLDGLARFCRFPQGIPPGVNVNLITPIY